MMDKKETLQRIENNFKAFKIDYKNNETVDVGLACGVANSVGYLLEEVKQLTEQIKSLESNLTLLDLDNQKYKDMCREHYEEMLKQEKKANQLEIDVTYWKNSYQLKGKE